MLKVESVSKSFGERSILNNINLEVTEKKIIAITGKSGTGKSTLLGIISGLLRPDSGKVYFQGQNIFRWTDFTRSRFRNKKMGFVFQFFSLFPEMTAYENIMYPAILNPFTGKKIKKEIDELTDYLQLTNIIHQYPSTLSGGERQRVAIARAAINHPKLILADEPTGNLDDENTMSILELFIKLKKDKGITTILATHDSKLVGNSDIAYIIENSRLVKINKKVGKKKKKSSSKDIISKEKSRHAKSTKS